MILELTGSVAGGAIGGYFLDEAFGTRPILTVTLLLGGCATGVMLLIRLVRMLERSTDADTETSEAKDE